MRSEEDEISELLQQLERAFGGLPIPSSHDVVLDTSDYDFESEQIKNKFGGRHWRDLNTDDLIGESSSLGFFKIGAFRFFLPAFIRISVLDPKSADLISDSILWNLAWPDDSKLWEERKDLWLETVRSRGIPEQIVFDLEPKEDPEIIEACGQRVAALNAVQRAAVLQYIAYLRKYRADEFDEADLDRAESALRQ
jgi:hypothetical protein